MISNIRNAVRYNLDSTRNNYYDFICEMCSNNFEFGNADNAKGQFKFLTVD